MLNISAFIAQQFSFHCSTVQLSLLNSSASIAQQFSFHCSTVQLSLLNRSVFIAQQFSFHCSTVQLSLLNSSVFIAQPFSFHCSTVQLSLLNSSAFIAQQFSFHCSTVQLSLLHSSAFIAPQFSFNCSTALSLPHSWILYTCICCYIYKALLFTMAVVNGMLSMKLEANADTQTISKMATTSWLPCSTPPIRVFTPSPISLMRPNSFKAWKTKYIHETCTVKPLWTAHPWNETVFLEGIPV